MRKRREGKHKTFSIPLEGKSNEDICRELQSTLDSITPGLGFGCIPVVKMDISSSGRHLYVVVRFQRAQSMGLRLGAQVITLQGDQDMRYHLHDKLGYCQDRSGKRFFSVCLKRDD